MPHFDSVHNYFETMVWEQIQNMVDDGTGKDQDFLEDVACVALNRLPPKYVRDNVDTSFYMSATERDQLEQAVYEAVAYAVKLVSDNPVGPNRG